VTPTLGLRANAPQFALLVGLNAFVGAVVGLERSVLPLVGERDFGIDSSAAVLAFVVAFGAAKALTNIAAGSLAERVGRKPVLVAGWLLALPAAPLVGAAGGWTPIVVANLFLGASQGLAWSMTVLMKVDLVGPVRRGFALGLNEAAGYIGVAVTAFATGALAAEVAPRTLVWVGIASLGAIGVTASAVLVRETSGHVAVEQASGRAPSFGRDRTLRACAQAGFVNNLNDALAWGLVPLYLAAHGASAREIGAAAAIYPAVWGVGQIAAGWVSDFVGRKAPIVAGMLVQAAALVLLAAGRGDVPAAIAAAALLGVGTALVYPTLLAAVSDAVEPRRRARALAVYRFWRDAGLVAGALLAGIAADAFGSEAAIALVGALTAASGLWAAAAPIDAADGRHRRRGVDASAVAP
jgi:MFS family permease